MTRERGSIALYLLFSIVVSSAVGYVVYLAIRDHVKEVEARERAEAARPKPTPPREPPRPEIETTPEPAHAEAVPPEPAPAEVSETRDPLADAAEIAMASAEDPDLVNATGTPVFGTPGIAGAMERSSVERRYRARRTLLQQCSELTPMTAVTVRAVFVVGKTGRVERAGVTGTNDRRVAACLESVIESVTFSAPRDGKPVVVVYPIAFVPQ